MLWKLEQLILVPLLLPERIDRHKIGKRQYILGYPGKVQNQFVKGRDKSSTVDCR